MTNYKYCLVPMCKSTTTKTPNKKFFNVPRELNLRKKWFKLMRLNFMPSIKSSLCCCEDHFDLKEDTDNYMQYKIMHEERGHIIKLRLKTNVLPHIFHCQNRNVVKKKRSYITKKIRSELVQQAMASYSDPVPSTPDEPVPSQFVDPALNWDTMSRGNGGGQWNNRVSYSQLMALANYFEEHPYLARGLSRSKEDRHKSSQLWEEVALILNSQGSGSIKTPLMWSKYWTDLKSKLKIRNALSKKSDTGTSVFEFSEVEKKFFVLLGPDFGAEVPVNTFLTQPSSSSTCSNDEDIAPYIKNELIMEIKEENEEIDYGSHANSDHLYTVETVRQHSPPASSPPPDSPPPVSPPPASPPPASPPRTRSAASASSPPRKDSTKTRNRRRTRPQTQLDAARTILVDIEKDRVQAEMTTALALKDIAQYQERRAIAEERNAMARERLALVEQRRLSLQLRDFNKRLKLYF